MHRKYPDLQRSPLDLRPPINLTFNRMEELRDRYHITSSLNGMKLLFYNPTFLADFTSFKATQMTNDR